MTNAQAALIAASNSAVRGSAVPVEPVLRRAAAFLLWLDSQEQQANVNAPIAVHHKPQAIVQCEAASTNYTRCMLASGHKGEHRNSAEGEYWEDATERPVHFIPSPSARHTVCGRGTGVTENGYRRVTTSVMGVTCDTCKEDLGL
jgi:hypothetical protein